AGGIASSSAPQEHLSANLLALQKDRIVYTLHFRKHGVVFYQPGADGEIEAIMISLSHGNQANFALQALGVVDIDIGNLADTDGCNVCRRHARVKSQSRKDA